MNRVVLKLALFALAVVAVGACNYWFINGPLLQHNTAVGLSQFKGTPAPAGDFEIAGYWVTFNTVYRVEAVALALLGTVLFLPHILVLFFGLPQSKPNLADGDEVRTANGEVFIVKKKNG